jgi:hypothetical protein
MSKFLWLEVGNPHDMVVDSQNEAVFILAVDSNKNYLGLLPTGPASKHSKLQTNRDLRSNLEFS